MKELAASPDTYRASILEVAGSGATFDDLVRMEVAWKEKLGTRVKGLNRN